MTREWSTGTVAMVTVFGQEHVAIRQGHGWCNGCADENTMGPVKSVRPLLVLDPEDREQVLRLADCLDAAFAAIDPAGFAEAPEVDDEVSASIVQEALRSLLDPKPEEPKGLGAVVRDREGKRYTRMDSRDPQPWWQDSTGDDEQPVARMFAWSDIDATEVLSHGVPEDGAR